MEKELSKCKAYRDVDTDESSSSSPSSSFPSSCDDEIDVSMYVLSVDNVVLRSSFGSPRGLERAGRLRVDCGRETEESSLSLSPKAGSKTPLRLPLPLVADR